MDTSFSLPEMQQLIAQVDAEIASIEARIRTFAPEPYVPAPPPPAPPPPPAAKAAPKTEAKIENKRFDRTETITTEVETPLGKEKTTETRTRKVDTSGVATSQKTVVESTEGDKKFTATASKGRKLGSTTTWESSLSLEEKDGDKKKHVKTSSSGKLSSSGLERTESREVSGDGRMSSEKTTTSFSAKGGEYTAGKTSVRQDAILGEDGKPASGATTTASASGGLVAKPGEVGALGSASAKRESDHGKGLKSHTSGGLKGRFTVAVQEIPKSKPKQFQILLTVLLGGEVGGGGSKGVEVEAKASGTVSAVFKHTLSEPDAQAYLSGLTAASKGSADGKLPEFAVLATGVKSGWNAAKAAYEGASASMGSAESARKMADGDSVETSTEASISGKGKLKGNLGVVALGAEGGASASKKVKKAVQKKGDKVLFTVDVTDGAGLTGGGSAGAFGVTMGVTGAESETSTGSVTLSLDPNDPQYEAIAAAVRKSMTLAEVDALQKRYPQLVAARSTGKTTTASTTKKLGAGPVSLEMVEGASRAHKESIDKDGKKTVDDEGANTGGMTLAVGKEKLTVSQEEKLTGQTDSAGKAAADLRRTNTETDIAKSLTAAARKSKKELVSGDKPILQTSSKIAGMQLSDGDIASLMKKAKSKEQWMKGQYDGKLFKDWEACRAAVAAAGGDKQKAVEALAAFVGTGGRGRQEMIEIAVRGVSKGGSRYEFPDGLAEQKKEYDALVVADPTGKIDALAGAGKRPEALALAQDLKKRLDALHAKLKGAQASFQDASALAEMLRNITDRASAVGAKLLALQGNDKGEVERKAALDRYTALLSNCRSFQAQQETDLAKIREMYDGDTDRISSRDMAASFKIVTAIEGMFRLWDAAVEEMAGLAQAHGFDKGIYERHRPDRARVMRARTGKNPGPPPAR